MAESTDVPPLPPLYPVVASRIAGHSASDNKPKVMLMKQGSGYDMIYVATFLVFADPKLYNIMTVQLTVFGIK